MTDLHDAGVADRLILRTPCISPGRLTSLWNKEQAMGKYFLAWILGVPAFVLVLIYFFVH